MVALGLITNYQNPNLDILEEVLQQGRWLSRLNNAKLNSFRHCRSARGE